MKEKKEVKNQLKDKVKMITAVNEALSFKKSNSDSEKVLRHISQFVKKEKNRDSKRAMIAAASKAVDISEKYSFLSDKEVIKRIMPELREILKKID